MDKPGDGKGGYTYAATQLLPAERLLQCTAPIFVCRAHALDGWGKHSPYMIQTQQPSQAPHLRHRGDCY